MSGGHHPSSSVDESSTGAAGHEVAAWWEAKDGMTDVVDYPLGGSFSLHHGPFNSRAYLMSWSPKVLANAAKQVANESHTDDAQIGMSATIPTMTECVKYCVDVAVRHSYSKLIIKAPRWASPFVTDPRGTFAASAVMPGYYATSPSPAEGGGDAVFFTAFVAGNSLIAPTIMADIPDYILRAASSSSIEEGGSASRHATGPYNATTVEIVECIMRPDIDAARVCHLLRQCFATYPFPCFHEMYVAEAMRSRSAVYFIAVDRETGSDVGCSAAELDSKNLAAEMSDFAVLPSQRGRGVATALLARMEDFVASGPCLAISEDEAARHAPFRLVYSIARASMPAVNLMFYRRGYAYGGLLERNTNIGGGIEAMNIWSKPLLLK